jgi:hypothetical protein
VGQVSVNPKSSLNVAELLGDRGLRSATLVIDIHQWAKERTAAF